MRKRMVNRKLAGIALSASLIAGGGALAVVSAAPVLAQEIETESMNPFQTFIQSLIDDGVVSQDQADTIAERAEAARAEFGDRGPRDPRGNRGAKLESPAEAIGITADELKTALQEGSTIADVAADNGVDVQVVVDAMIADHQEKLETAVADGRLTAEEAAEKATEIADHVQDVVNGEVPENLGEGRGRRGGPGRGQGGPGFGPFGGSGADAEVPATDA